MSLKELKLDEVRNIVTLARNRSAIKLPEEYSLGDAKGPEWIAWEQASERIENLLGNLSPAALHELQALMWLGRGDSGDDFNTLIEHAIRTQDGGTIKYISAKSSLDSYLVDGSKKLGIAI